MEWISDPQAWVGFATLTVLEIDKVPGSGVLQFMHDGMTVSVRDAAVLMTVLSDNTATNLLLDRIIIRRVWQKMEALGLPHTKVHSKTFLRISSVASVDAPSQTRYSSSAPPDLNTDCPRTERTVSSM